MDKMIVSDMTYNEISIVKEDIENFIFMLKKVSVNQGSELKQVDEDFFSFLAKQIVFLKNIYFLGGKVYVVSVLISDYYNYILAIIKNEHRYIYLNERSIIENYARLVLYKMVEDDFNVSQMLSILREKFSDILLPENFSLLKSEYRIASSYIHGGNELAKSLAFYFENCLRRDFPFKNKSNYYENIQKLLKLNIKIFIRRYLNLVDGIFHRRKSLLGYLLGKSMLDFLFYERNKNMNY